MKTLALLFSFAFVLVFTAPTKTSDEHHLLRRIMIKANKTRDEGPEPKDFCIAEKILSNINEEQYGTSDNNIGTVSRELKQYNMLHPSNCTVKNNVDEEQLRALLMNLYDCAQIIYARPHPVTHHKTTPAL